MSYDDDAKLVGLIRLGNKEAFEKIYHRYHKPLYYFAMKYLKNKELSEDALQDFYVKMWEQRASLDPDKSIKKFLFTCLKNHLLNAIRNQKNKQLIAAEMDNQVDHSQNGTSENVSYSELNHVIKRGLSELPGRQHEVFKLKIFEEFNNPEIAGELGISLNTAKVHYYHSSQFIKTYIKKHWGDDYQP